MGNKRVTQAVFLDSDLAETYPLYQYDYGQVLKISGIELPQTFEVLFSNGVSYNAKRVIGTDYEVDIPDELLMMNKNIIGWIFLHDGETDGETEYTIRVPIKPRSKVVEGEFTPQEQDVISQLVSTISALSEQIKDLESDIVVLQARIPALGGWKTEDESGDTSGG